MRRSRATVLVNLAPLLDVILLLLLFVMLSATFEARRSMRLELPSAATATAAASQALTVALDAEGRTLVDGEPLGPDALRALLAGQAARGGAVRLAADRRAATGALVEILDAARAAGVRDVRIATRPGDGGSPR